MKRALIAAGYAIAGLVLAVGLTLGAYAVAGRDLSEPPQPVRVGPLAPPQADDAGPTDSPSPADSASPERDDNGGDRDRTDDRTPDDRTDDRSGSNSGSGSDSSGSGSGRSGSGSGSGSDDD